MKTRFSCMLVVLFVLTFGTLANALPTPVYNCVGLVCTVTQTLYYTGTLTGPGNNGIGSTTQVYTAPNGGVGSGSGLGGASLVSANWQASYTFNSYNSLSTGYSLVSAVVSVVDSTTGTIAGTQTSNVDGWYGYSATTTAQFSTNPTVLGGSLVSAFLNDGNIDAYSGVNTDFAGPPNGPTGQDTSSNAGACSKNSAQINGSFDNPTSGTPPGTDTCVYIVNNGFVSISGYTNDTASASAGGVNLPTSTFTTGSTAVLYELLTSTGGGQGNSEGLAESGAGGTEIQVVYTYDLPNPNPGTPEPATLLLLGSGLSLVASRLRRKSAVK